MVISIFLTAISGVGSILIRGNILWCENCCSESRRSLCPFRECLWSTEGQNAFLVHTFLVPRCPAHCVNWLKLDWRNQCSPTFVSPRYLRWNILTDYLHIRRRKKRKCLLISLPLTPELITATCARLPSHSTTPECRIFASGWVMSVRSFSHSTSRKPVDPALTQLWFLKSVHQSCPR